MLYICPGLFYQREFSADKAVSGLQSVDVHAAAQARSVKHSFVFPCGSAPVNQFGHLPACEVGYCKLNIHTLGYRVSDNG